MRPERRNAPRNGTCRLSGTLPLARPCLVGLRSPRHLNPGTHRTVYHRYQTLSSAVRGIALQGGKMAYEGYGTCGRAVRAVEGAPSWRHHGSFLRSSDRPGKVGRVTKRIPVLQSGILRAKIALRFGQRDSNVASPHSAGVSLGRRTRDGGGSSDRFRLGPRVLRASARPALSPLGSHCIPTLDSTNPSPGTFKMIERSCRSPSHACFQNAV